MQNYHVWQDQGYVPPFKLVGFYAIPSRSLAEANPSAYNNELALMPKGCGIGSCAICGTPLINNFIIRDKNGTTFSVGCDCVSKYGDTKLITDVEFKKKALAKKARAAKAEAKRLAAYEAHQQELNAQRERNGGMTDFELEQHNLAIKRKARIAAINTLLYPVIKILKGKKGNFCASVSDTLEEGRLRDLSAYALSIIDDICTKGGLDNFRELYSQAQLIE